MEEDRKLAFKVGVLMLVIVALFVAVILYIPPFLSGGPTYSVVVLFPQRYPLPPLDKGSAIVVGGQKVGTVQKVTLETQPPSPTVRGSSSPETTATQPTRANLYVMISSDVDQKVVLRTDAKARAEAPPLGGLGQIVIDIGQNADALIAKNSVIVLEGEYPAGLGAAVQTLSETLSRELNAADPNSLLGRIKMQLDEGQANSIIAKLQRSMDDINAMTRGVRLQLDPDQRDALIRKVNAAMDNLNAATAALRDELDPRRPEAALAGVHRALDSLGAGLATVAEIVRENRAPIGESLRHIERTTASIDNRIIDPLAAEFDRQNRAGLLAKFHGATDDLKGALENISTLSAAGREVVVLNRDNVSAILRNLRQTSDHLNSSIKFILRRPWMLLNPPPKSETREQDILDAARVFAEAASRLDNVMSDLRSLSEAHDGRIPATSPELARIRDELKETVTKFAEAEQALFKNLNVK